MIMENKFEIEYENEFVDYLLINEKDYFSFDIVGFEVRFKVCMKAIDIFGMDEYYYHIIEVKRGAIDEDDYNNLECIIRNNRYNKPFKGLLIGTKGNKKVERMCKENGNIECMIVEDVIYKKKNDILQPNKLSDRSGWVKSYSNLYQKLFTCTNGYKICNYDISHKEINIKFESYDNNEILLKITKNGVHIFKFIRHEIFKDRWIEESFQYPCPLCYIDEYLFVNYYAYKIKFMRCIYFSEKNLCNHYRAIYNVINPLKKYINIDYIKFYDTNKLLVTDTEFLGIRIFEFKPYNRYIIIPELYSNIVRDNIDKIEKCIDTNEYNTINIIECCYIFIGKKLYKPEIKIDFYKEYLTIELSIKLKNGKKFEKYYDIVNKKSDFNKKAYKKEFFLICNIYFILDFEKYIKSKMDEYNCKIDDYYFDSYTTSLYKYCTEDKIRKNINGVHKDKKYLTLRNIIELSGDEMKRVYKKVMEEEYSRVKILKGKGY